MPHGRAARELKKKGNAGGREGMGGRADWSEGRREKGGEGGWEGEGEERRGDGQTEVGW